MEYFHDYFICEECGSRNFKRIYNFSLRFRKVNFSEKLIYDKLTDEIYQCTQCQKTYTTDEIEEKLALIKANRRESKSL